MAICVANKLKRYLTGELDDFTESTCRRRTVESMRKPLFIAGTSLLCHESSDTANRVMSISYRRQPLLRISFGTSSVIILSIKSRRCELKCHFLVTYDDTTGYTVIQMICLYFLQGVSIAASPVLATIGMSVCLPVCPSVTRWHWAKTTQARITKSSPTDSPMTLVFGIKNSSRNSKGFTPSEGVKWEWGRKNSQFSANNSPYLRNSAR